MRTLIRIVATILTIATVLAVSAFALYYFVPQPPENDSAANGVGLNAEDTYNILFCGLDESGENTDTILLISFDAKNTEAKILSIPRDTMSNADRVPQKINAAYSDGRPENIEKTKKEVEMLTGLRIHRYAVSTFDAFANLIDALGGVEIDVPADMYYEDPYQDLKIDIKAGRQVLDGEHAVHFLRYRDTYLEGDIGRVKAQQLFYQALINELSKPSNVTKLPELAEVFEKDLHTDLSLPELLWFAKKSKGFDTENNLKMFILPGSPQYVGEISYYIPALTNILNMINNEFTPPGVKIQAEDLNLVPEAVHIIADTGYGTNNDDLKYTDPASPEWQEEIGIEPLYPPAQAPQYTTDANYGYGTAYVPPPEDNTGQSTRGYTTHVTTEQVPTYTPPAEQPPAPAPAPADSLPVATPVEGPAEGTGG